MAFFGNRGFDCLFDACRRQLSLTWAHSHSMSQSQCLVACNCFSFQVLRCCFFIFFGCPSVYILQELWLARTTRILILLIPSPSPNSTTTSPGSTSSNTAARRAGKNRWEIPTWIATNRYTYTSIITHSCWTFLSFSIIRTCCSSGVGREIEPGLGYYNCNVLQQWHLAHLGLQMCSAPSFSSQDQIGQTTLGNRTVTVKANCAVPSGARCHSVPLGATHHSKLSDFVSKEKVLCDVLCVAFHRQVHVHETCGRYQ